MTHCKPTSTTSSPTTGSLARQVLQSEGHLIKAILSEQPSKKLRTITISILRSITLTSIIRTSTTFSKPITISEEAKATRKKTKQMLKRPPKKLLQRVKTQVSQSSKNWFRSCFISRIMWTTTLTRITSWWSINARLNSSRTSKTIPVTFRNRVAVSPPKTHRVAQQATRHRSMVESKAKETFPFSLHIISRWRSKPRQSSTCSMYSKIRRQARSTLAPTNLHLSSKPGTWDSSLNSRLRGLKEQTVMEATLATTLADQMVTKT